jgi:hypothetical protein
MPLDESAVLRPCGYTKFREMDPGMEGNLGVRVEAYQTRLRSVDPKRIIDILPQRTAGEIVGLRAQFRDMGDNFD